MQFEILDRRWNRTEPIRLRVDGELIPLSRRWPGFLAAYQELSWRWIDGHQYSLRVPVPRRGVPHEWSISADERHLCTGRVTMRGLTWSPALEWSFDPEIYPRAIRRAGLCRRSLIDAGNRRLACWRTRWWRTRVAVHPAIPPIVAGGLVVIIVETVYSPVD